MPGDEPDRDGVTVHDHHPVEGHVLLALVLGDDDTGCDVASPVLGEVLGDGKGHEVHLAGHRTEGGVLHDLACAGGADGLEQMLHDSVTWDVERLCGLLPGGEDVSGGPSAVEVLEDDGGLLVIHEPPRHVTGVGVDRIGDGHDVPEEGFLYCHV